MVVPRPPSLDEAVLRQAIFDTAALFVGKVERTNQNDADWIRAINRYNRLPDRAMYCASAFYYVHARNGVALPIAPVSVGRVNAYFRDPTKIVWRRGQRGNARLGMKIGRMDAVSLYASHIEGIAQDRFDPTEDEEVLCIGFNTTGGRGTRGGCYLNRRRTKEIKLIANWITPFLEAYIGKTPGRSSKPLTF